MTFNEVYTAVMNNRVKELDKVELFNTLNRQELNLQQQQYALNRCVFGRKRHMSGRVSKYTTGEHMQGKPGPWFNHIESDRVLKKLEAVNALYEKLSLVKKKLNS